ncbi:unnamed protein product [Citrullus colocynthis]|uniref:Uncharacterized protein n=1 Tax=Citrullus colocynthis TaxID=252529 RepID=A0ABP0YLN2_9ROSI
MIRTQPEPNFGNGFMLPHFVDGCPFSFPFSFIFTFTFCCFLSFLSLWGSFWISLLASLNIVSDCCAHRYLILRVCQSISHLSSFFLVSGVELSNPSGEGEKRLEEDSGLGILSCETLQIGEDFCNATPIRPSITGVLGKCYSLRKQSFVYNFFQFQAVFL